MATDPFLSAYLSRANAARAEAHAILAVHEAAVTSRVVLLSELRKRTKALPVDVSDYFNEAIHCLEVRAYRAAMVFSWAGFFHLFCEALMHNHEAALRACRPKWQFADLSELKDTYAESQILDASKEAGMIRRAVLRILQGHLSTRNQCAHPTLYRPSANVAIGFVEAMLTEAQRWI